MITNFCGKLKPFYFWTKLPFTQWTDTPNQFEYLYRTPTYGGLGGHNHYDECIIKFSSAEQWMMWQKARLFSDYRTANEILESVNPEHAKALGRKVKNFDEHVWTKRRLDIVYAGNMLKFTQNPKWAEELKDVVRNGMYFVEASPYDKIWGIGIGPDDARKGCEWKGENLLGIVLTNVAIALIKEEQRVIYQEDVNYAGVPATDALIEYLKQFIDVELYPNMHALENEFCDLVTKFVEDRWAIGEFRHHH